MPELPAFPTFRDRDLELGAMTAGPSEEVRVLNFHGEAGIGKSRLLKEGAARLRTKSHALVLQVDLEQVALAVPREVRQFELLKQLAEQADLPDLSPVAPGDPDDAAGQIVDRLSLIGGERPVTLLVDTTEALQDDPGLWQWFEKYVLSPLVSEGKILVVLAGRLPAPIRLVEVRRYLKVTSLPPLPVKDEARRLVREVLATVSGNGSISDGKAPKRRATALAESKLGRTEKDELTDMALAFSQGHPLLSQQIAQYIGDPTHREPLDTLRRRVAEEVVGKFINEQLFPFEAEMARWRPVVEWASVLDWFDVTVFYRFYVAMSGSQPSETDWQYDFVKAMARLRAPYAVVKWQDEGYTLVGTIKSIVARYLQAARHEEYVKALAAADKVFNEIAVEDFADNPQAGEPYREAARAYRKRLDLEVQNGPAEQPRS